MSIKTFTLRESGEPAVLLKDHQAAIAQAEALIRDLLNPEMYGYAVTPEVRDRARLVLGIAPCEALKPATSFNHDNAWRDALEKKA